MIEQKWFEKRWPSRQGETKSNNITTEYKEESISSTANEESI